MNDFTDKLVEAAVLAENHQWDEALAAYNAADLMSKQSEAHFELNPMLQLLRSRAGKVDGGMSVPPPTENSILRAVKSQTSPDCLQWVVPDEEQKSTAGLKPPTLDPDRMLKGISEMMGNLPVAKYHLDNIKEEMPHIQVLSTGRCGTVSLYHLLENLQPDCVPYHSFIHTLPIAFRQELAYRILHNEIDNMQTLVHSFVWGRSAEWIGAMNEGKWMVDVNHMDVVYAPVFAAIHPKSDFVFLYRDWVKTFESFYSKEQWSYRQIRPLFTGFDGGFKWRETGWDIPTCIAWYFRWTQKYITAFAKAFPGRLALINADRLFAGDREEIERLCSVFNISDVDAVVEHYKISRNTKAHKITMTPEQIAAGTAQFRQAFEQFGGQL